MADTALGSVCKIVDIALKIKEAVETVKQNEKECHDIQKCVTRVTALIKRLDEVTEAMKDKVMRDALEDLAESLQGALELVTKCQRKHAFRRFIGAGDMAKALRLVQDDILRKVTMGSFATNVVQLGITLMTIAHQQGAGTEKPTHVGPIITDDASDGRYETDQTSKFATGCGAVFNPLSGLTKFSLSELKVATHDFSENNTIGMGTFARVFKGLLRTGIVVAVKQHGDMEQHRSMLLNEMNIGVKLQHKNVVKTLGYCDEFEPILIEHKGRIIQGSVIKCFLVVAYLPNGSLDGIIRSGTQRVYWPFCFRTILGIAQGLHYIHQQNVVHHDMKPENILFDSDMNPVIIDFGHSRLLDNDDYIIAMDAAGTLGYMPPEYIDKYILSKKYDVFSFGVILIRTISRACFKVESQDPEFEWDAVLQEGVDKIKEFFDPTFVEESELTEVVRCLKVGLLCREFDRADRPTMSEVLDMLNGNKEVPARKNKPSIV